MNAVVPNRVLKEILQSWSGRVLFERGKVVFIVYDKQRSREKGWQNVRKKPVAWNDLTEELQCIILLLK